MKTRSQLASLVLFAAIAAAGTAILVSAAPGTLNPPPGPVSGTGHTLTEIYDKIQSVESSLVGVGNPSTTEVVLVPTLPEDSAPVSVGGTGQAIVRSVVISTGSVSIQDSTGKSLGRIYAQATYRGNSGNIFYDSTYQVDYNMRVMLPLQVDQSNGTEQTAELFIVIERLP